MPASDDPYERACQIFDEAWRLRNAGEFEAAFSTARQARDQLECTAGANHPDFANGLLLCAGLHQTATYAKYGESHSPEKDAKEKRVVILGDEIQRPCEYQRSGNEQAY